MGKAERAALLKGAESCREIQALYCKQAKGLRRKPDLRTLIEGCAAGAGACAVNLEAMAGLSLAQITTRAVARSIGGRGA